MGKKNKKKGGAAKAAAPAAPKVEEKVEVPKPVPKPKASPKASPVLAAAQPEVPPVEAVVAGRDFGAEKLARKVAEMPDVDPDIDLAALRAKAQGAKMSDEEKKKRGLLYDTSIASAVREEEEEEEDEGEADFAMGDPFDFLGDDAAEEATEEVEQGPKNSAFVFIKPHAVTEEVKALTKKSLQAKGLTITSEGSITSEEIDAKKLIDQHYYAIASKATILKPEQLNVPAGKFKSQFGLEWKDALAAGNVFNAMDGCAKLGIDADEMDKQWAICKKAKKLVKFGGGFYCGLIEIKGKPSVYVFNGFFMSMRSKFTAPGLSIYYYTVEWALKDLSWGDFRGKVLGPTDPAEAPKDSLRGMVLADWKKLGLAAEPDVGDNGVHASASPFEAAAERNNWLQVPFTEDSYGQELLAAGLPEATLKAWSVDPQVPLPEGGKGSLFDAVEDLDSTVCIARLDEILKTKPEQPQQSQSAPVTQPSKIDAAGVVESPAKTTDNSMIVTTAVQPTPPTKVGAVEDQGVCAACTVM